MQSTMGKCSLVLTLLFCGEPLSLQMRDWTGLERRMSASTESLWTRGESPMNFRVSGGEKNKYIK